MHINTGNFMYTPEPAHHSSVHWLTLHLYQAFSKVAEVLPAKKQNETSPQKLVVVHTQQDNYLYCKCPEGDNYTYCKCP